MANPVTIGGGAALITHTGATNGTNSPDQTNLSHRGIKVYINITVITAGSITVTIQGKDPVSGTYYTILTSAAFVAIGFNMIEVYPGLPSSSNVSANDVLPDTWRIQTAINTGPVTATISISKLI